MKISFGFLAAGLLVCCTPSQQTVPGPSEENIESADPGNDDKPRGDLVQILDSKGNTLCKVDAGASCTATDAGILYGIFTPGENQSTAPATYRLLSPETNESMAGTDIDNQGYEPVFARTELGSNAYTLNLIGNPMDNARDDLMLYGFSSDAVTETRVSSCGFPYAAMTRSGDKLLIMNHEMSRPQCDKVYSYDQKQLKEILSFPEGDKSESLRSIYGTEDGFYLLRLHIDGSSTELFADRYDSDCNILSSKSLSSLITSAALNDGLTGEDAIAQVGMHVAGFRVVDDRYLFYENFSMTRVIIDLEQDKVLFSGNDLYQMSTGSGRPLFYKLQFSESDGLDIVGIKDGAVEHISSVPAAYPSSSGLLLQGISTSPCGNCLYRFSTPTFTTSYVWVRGGN